MPNDYLEIGDVNKKLNEKNIDISPKNSQPKRKIEVDFSKLKSNKSSTKENTINNNIKEDSNDIFSTKDLFKDEERTTKEESKNQGSWIVILTLIGMLYFIYQPVSNIIINYLQNNPSIYRYYLELITAVNNNNLNGLIIVSILGSLFFMILPSEAIFIYYLNATTYSPILIIAFIIIGSGIGLSFNYFFGLLMGEKVLRFIFSKNFEKYQNIINKWGTLFIFFGNILPGPIEVISVFFGSFRFNYIKFILISMLGRLIKYSILLIAFYFFWDQLTLYYNDFINML